jgi:hypothetical protein
MVPKLLTLVIASPHKTSAECNEDSYLAILHLSRVELHCKLQEKLHRVTWPIVESKGGFPVLARSYWQLAASDA